MTMQPPLTPDDLARQQMAFSLHAVACAQAARRAERWGDVAAAAEWDWCRKKCRGMIAEIQQEKRRADYRTAAGQR